MATHYGWRRDPERTASVQRSHAYSAPWAGRSPAVSAPARWYDRQRLSGKLPTPGSIFSRYAPFLIPRKLAWAAARLQLPLDSFLEELMSDDAVSVANLQYHYVPVGFMSIKALRTRHADRVCMRSVASRRYPDDAASDASAAPRVDRALWIRDHCANDAARHAANASQSSVGGCKCNAF